MIPTMPKTWAFDLVWQERAAAALCEPGGGYAYRLVVMRWFRDGCPGADPHNDLLIHEYIVMHYPLVAPPEGGAK